MEKKEYERITRLETQIEGMSESVGRIETKLDAYTANFLPRSEADLRFKNIEKEIDQTKNNRKANAALVVSITGVAVGFIFSLLNYVN